VTTPTQPTHPSAALLAHLIGALLVNGYTRTRVDTLTSPDGTRSVRHHYSSDEWTFTVITDQTQHALRYNVRDAMPDLAQLMQTIQDVPTKTTTE